MFMTIRMNENRIVVLRTRGEFKSFLLNNDAFIVKASAEWCGPCKRCLPQFMELFNALPSHIRLIKLDVDEGEDLAHYLKIKSMPTFIHYFKGEPKEIYNSSRPNDVQHFFDTVRRYY